MSAATRADLEAGHLSQFCGVCGRFSAATRYCSWCFKPMGPADWFKGTKGDAPEQRAERMPKSRPENPAPEYLTVRDWPPQWGPCPATPAVAQGHGAPKGSEAVSLSTATPEPSPVV